MEIPRTPISLNDALRLVECVGMQFVGEPPRPLGHVPQFLSNVPSEIPAGCLLVHDDRHAWLTEATDTRVTPCDCPWASEHPIHYRSKRHDEP